MVVQTKTHVISQKDWNKTKPSSAGSLTGVPVEQTSSETDGELPALKVGSCSPLLWRSLAGVFLSTLTSDW